MTEINVFTIVTVCFYRRILTDNVFVSYITILK